MYLLINQKDHCPLFKNIKVFDWILPLLKKKKLSDRQYTGNQWINSLIKLIIQIFFWSLFSLPDFFVKISQSLLLAHSFIFYIHTRALLIIYIQNSILSLSVSVIVFTSLMLRWPIFLAIDTFLWIGNIMQENSNN